MRPNEFAIRPARRGDDETIDQIARDGDSKAPIDYLDMVRALGRVVVATIDDAVVGFGGVIDTPQAAMLTDLFVTPAARGAGVGGALLVELFADAPHRMTFSSKHPAALAAYQRAGMIPQWRLLYLQGRVPTTLDRTARAAPSGVWGHDRRDLIEQFAKQRGAVIDTDVVVTISDAVASIERVHSGAPTEALTIALARLGVGAVVELQSPEHSPLSAFAASLGFEVVDHDVFCASPGVTLPAAVHALHPGFA